MSKDILDEFEDSLLRLKEAKFTFWGGTLAFEGLLIAVSVGVLAISSTEPLVQLLAAISTWLLMWASYLTIRIFKNFVKHYQNIVNISYKVVSKSHKISADVYAESQASADELSSKNEKLEDDAMLFVEASMVILSLCILILLF